MVATVSSSTSIIRAERARRDFALFVKLAWPVIEPGVRLMWNWHIDCIAEHLQAVFNGQIKRLLVNIQPGVAKSTIFSQCFPAWTWTQDPSIRWLCASNSLDLAIRDNKNCRDLIQSEWYQENYGHMFKMKSDQNVKSYFENDHRGYRVAVSVGSKGTGKRGTHLLIDDPNDAKDGEAEILAVKEWFGKTWMSRINDQENGPMIVVGQRLHEQDLSGHILELGGWEHLVLPTEFDTSRRFYTSIGWTDPRTKDGELLCPQQYNRETLEKLKHSLGPLDYAAQFDQSPTPATGGTFNRKNERLFTQNMDTYFLHTPKGIKAFAKEDCTLFVDVDPAISEEQSADFMVIGLWAMTPIKDLLLLHVTRGRWDHHAQQVEIEDAFNDSNAEFVAVETVAYQHALFQDLIIKGIPCRPFKPHKNKVARGATASIWQGNGKIYFLKNADWLPELQKELYKFPRYRYDDQVDMISLASIVARSRGPLSDAGNNDDIPDAAEETGGLIPLTHPLQGEDAALPVQTVISPHKEIDPFSWVDKHGGWGGDW